VFIERAVSVHLRVIEPSRGMPHARRVPAVETDVPRDIQPGWSASDRAYRRLAAGGGLLTLAVLVLIGLFLLVRSGGALDVMGARFFTTTVWRPDAPAPVFGILAVVYWTVVIAAIALAVAVPLSVLTALFLTEYAPRRVRPLLRSLVDLLAAIPSIVYGLWGLFFLQEHLVPVARWLTDRANGIPLLETTRPQYTGSAFVAGIVVALMVLPIVTSVVREVFQQAPPGEKEAALALGSTRWGMVRTVVLPFGRGGIVGGSMLGLGRALGETIAVALVISPTFEISPHVLETGSNSVASLIALKFGESDALSLSALMAAGLALFVLTLAVNVGASFVIGRSRSGVGVEA
jgi:phosphate transport system permease protein